LVDKRDKNTIKFHNIEKQMNEMKIDMNKNKNDEMTFKEQSGVVSGFGSSIKINENKSINIFSSLKIFICLDKFLILG